jgi:tetratricopeptide (TPR) repeat protein
MVSRALCRVNRQPVCWFSAGLLMSMVASSLALAGEKQAWIELRSPNFVVVTNAGERQARRTAYQFEMIRAVFREYFGKKQESDEQPVIILAAKDENTLKGLIPEFWAQKGASHPAGMYLGGSDADYIVLRLDVSLNQQAYEPFEPVYHEYVHYLTRQFIAHLPLWMVEGLAEFYGNTRITDKSVSLGTPSTSNLEILHDQRVLPVSVLFEIDPSSPYYHEQNKTSVFYAESWALTHYLFARDWHEHTHRVSDFIKLSASGVDPKDAASRTIGDAKTLDEPLRNYTNNSSFTAVKLEPPKIEEGGFRVRPVTETEALAVRADFMAHDRHYVEAQQMLQQALLADPKLGIVYDSLSFLALQKGNAADAEKWSSEGLALDSHDYRANYYYAWSLLKGRSIDEALLAKAEASLRAVLKGNPGFVPAYDAMAYVLAMGHEKEKLGEAYMMALQAVDREPGNVQHRLRMVEVLERQQRAEDAVRVATLAQSMAKTPQEAQAVSAALAGAQQFQTSLQKIRAMQTSESAAADGGSANIIPAYSNADQTSECVGRSYGPQQYSGCGFQLVYQPTGDGKDPAGMVAANSEGGHHRRREKRQSHNRLRDREGRLRWANEIEAVNARAGSR